MERFLNDPLYGDTVSNIGCDENTCIAYDEIATEDHSNVADERGNEAETKTREDSF